MRLKTLLADAVLPIRRVAADGLGDVVVIAGPNGVGKSRLVNAIIQKFQNLHRTPNVQLTVEATSATERKEWGKSLLDTSIPGDTNLLNQTLQKNRGRREWSSSVIHFESDRSIQRIDPFQFTWDYTDPWAESMGWNTTFGGLRARFQDTMHSLFRKVHSHEKEIAKRALELQRAGAGHMALDFPDPLAPFKESFYQLVGPKELTDLDPRTQELHYTYEGQRFPLSSLSSGEREVVNILFDFILRTSSDCIVFFDEPELHLHPELSYRLLQALRTAGTNNQFFFCTHSPEIITASLDQTVLFISPPAQETDGSPRNQAIRVEESDTTNRALRLLGQSIGIVALGKRVVLIEGDASSLDKQTYGFLLRNRFPSLVLVPAGGRAIIQSFAHIVDHVLDRTIWGVEFLMLCDHDATDSEEIERMEKESKGRLRFLKRYHLENYFLDAPTLAKVFEDFEPEGSWLRDAGAIEQRLLEIARDSLSYATALIVSSRVRRQFGNVDVMPKGCHGLSVNELVDLVSREAHDELTRAATTLDVVVVADMSRRVYLDLDSKLAAGFAEWKTVIPGRPVLSKFAAASGLEVGRLKLAYLTAVRRNELPIFDDVTSIFSDFATASAHK